MKKARKKDEDVGDEVIVCTSTFLDGPALI
jgi:hypothetical protein